jgi:hypothetical protein
MAFDIQTMFAQWESYGFYDFLLPFLLLFGIIFGVLSYMKIFSDNKGIHALIAVAVSLIAVRFPFFTDFVNVISPRIGVGLVVLLAVLILVGLFVAEKTQAIVGWIFTGIAALVALIIFLQVYNIFGFEDSFVFDEGLGALLMVVLVVGIIIVIVVASTVNKDGRGRMSSDKIEKLASLFGSGNGGS